MNVNITDVQRTWLRVNGTLLGRIFIGLLFFVSGISMYTSMGIAGFGAMLEGLGVPASGVVAVLVILVKVIGGIFLILGYKVDESALALFIFTFFTIVLVHNNATELTSALKNLAIMGGLLYVLAYGPGDGWRIGR